MLPWKFSYFLHEHLGCLASDHYIISNKAVLIAWAASGEAEAKIVFFILKILVAYEIFM
jgi:hypothetical protein